MSAPQVRTGDRRELSPAERSSLLEDAVARKDLRLLMQAVVFRQGDQPNENFVRFKASALRPLAKSFVGQPFLRDHDQDRVNSRVGTIVASEFSGGEGHGEIRQSIEVSDPEAIEQVLRGNIDRFSIGFKRLSDAEVVCSECDKPFVSMATFLGPMMAPSCNHMPGDYVDAKNGRRAVEAVFGGASGIETSAVNNPAVARTGIESVRASLSAGRLAFLAQGPQLQPKEKSMKSIALKLGLSEDAGEESIGKSIDTLAARSAAGAEALAARDRRVAELETELASYRKANHDTKLASLVEQVRAKIGPKLGADGKPVLGGTETERRILALAEKDMELAASVVADLPQVIPAQKLRSIAKDTPPSLPSALSDEEKLHCKRRGISEESYLEAKLEVMGKKKTGTDNDEEE